MEGAALQSAAFFVRRHSEHPVTFTLLQQLTQGSSRQLWRPAFFVAERRLNLAQPLKAEITARHP